MADRLPYPEGDIMGKLLLSMLIGALVMIGIDGKSRDELAGSLRSAVATVAEVVHK